MVCRATLGYSYSSLQTSPTQSATGVGVTGGAFKIAKSFPFNGQDWNQATTLTGAVYTLVDPFGNAVTAAGAGSFRNLVHYCEYPGERLFSKVKFEVNGNPLDEYVDVTSAMLRKFTIGADKITAYKRMMGQEVPIEGISGPVLSRVRDYDLSTKSTAVDHLTDANDTATNGTASNSSAFLAATFPENETGQIAPGANATYAPTITDAIVAQATAKHADSEMLFGAIRRKVSACRGPQTPKYWQPPLEIWNKLCFWFNNDSRLSIPSVSIPFGQRFITVDLAPQASLIYEYPGLFVKQVIETETAAVAGTSNGALTEVVRYRPYWVAGTVTTGALANVELYVNNIFVNPEVHSIYIKRIGFSLIRVFRRHSETGQTGATGSVLLSQLKWPIEYMFVGFRPAWNTNATDNPKNHRDWHRFTRVVDLLDTTMQQVDFSGSNAMNVWRGLNTATTPVAVAAGFDLTLKDGQIAPDEYAVELPVVDTVTITAHGIKIHDTFPESFFNSYVPYHYGKGQIVAPDDRGAMMINFALNPGTYQPSGHINVSRAREFYCDWASTYAGSNTALGLEVIAVAINFLLITDGSAVLRYST